MGWLGWGGVQWGGVRWVGVGWGVVGWGRVARVGLALGFKKQFALWGSHGVGGNTTIQDASASWGMGWVGWVDGCAGWGGAGLDGWVDGRLRTGGGQCKTTISDSGGVFWRTPLGGINGRSPYM